MKKETFIYHVGNAYCVVLESLINPFALKKRPWEVFFVGFLYSVIGLVLAYFVFREAAGLLMVFLIVIATLPIMYTTIKKEEELDLRYKKELKLLKEHTKVLLFLMFLFFGITTALVLSYVFLPQKMVDTIFSIQNEAIFSVNNNVQGGVVQFSYFMRIFFNNIKVLFFCIIFSLLYGTGAIFILTWNASVVAAAIGSLLKTELANTASMVGFTSVASYFGVATYSFLRYMVHGIPEMAAYFVAGLAGGIISIALIKHNFRNNRVLMDAVNLIFISIALLLVASVIEAYVTPVLFL